MATYGSTTTISLVPGEDLTEALNCVVTVDTDGNVVKPTDALAPIVGVVAMNADRATGATAIPVTLLKGIITLKAGGAISAGDLLVAEAATGKVLGVTGIAATTADTFIVGTALMDAVEDDVFSAVAMGSYTSSGS